jgi:uncharacterized protein YjbI with pentapeptide repeats
MMNWSGAGSIEAGPGCLRSGAVLAGARLEHAVRTGAVLQDADLTGTVWGERLNECLCRRESKFK